MGNNFTWYDYDQTVLHVRLEGKCCQAHEIIINHHPYIILRGQSDSLWSMIENLLMEIPLLCLKLQDILLEKSKHVKNSGRMSISPVKQPEKQMNESKPTWSDPLTKLSHSVSMPLQQRQSEDKVTAANGDARGGELSKGGEFDPIVGALILSVTLIVMLLWGKVSAILSTAIWFYVVPRFMRPTKIVQIVAHNNGMKNVSSENDLGSMEDKRKVVLQGFLERNN